MQSHSESARTHGAAAAFWASPRGRARQARRAGRKIFQIELPVSRTAGEVFPFLGAQSSTASVAADESLDGIELEGWVLSHAGYAYRPLASSSRDKFMFSGQQEAMSGEVVGVYVFRATEGDAPEFDTEPQRFDEQGGRETFRAF